MPSFFTTYHTSLLIISTNIIRIETGFLYESIIDNCTWNNINPRKFSTTFNSIGRIISMSDKQFQTLPVYSNSEEKMNRIYEQIKRNQPQT